MTVEELTVRYIRRTEKALAQIRMVRGLRDISTEDVDAVIESAKRYLEDAKYYQGSEKCETGLASVAYCEGLLDALRLLGLVKFSWGEGR